MKCLVAALWLWIGVALQAADAPLTIRITHETEYRYDRPVRSTEQIIRLVPCSTEGGRIGEFSFSVHPEGSSYAIEREGNGCSVIRVQLPPKTSGFGFRTSFLLFPNAERGVQVPESADRDMRIASSPARSDALKTGEFGRAFAELVASIKGGDTDPMRRAFGAIREIQRLVEYSEREEQGIWSPDATLENGRGSCRDLSVLLMHTLRHCGVPARFVSGYLVMPVDGGSYEIGFHAWCEAYICERGWVAFDPTSDGETGRFHVPLFRSCDLSTAGILSGMVERCEVSLSYQMKAEVVKEAAQPGATDNPDDAQRLREDH